MEVTKRREHEPGDAGGTRSLEPALGLERQPFS
jgi:hypothetical protein